MRADALAKFWCDLEPDGTMLWSNDNSSFINGRVAVDMNEMKLSLNEPRLGMAKLRLP